MLCHGLKALALRTVRDNHRGNHGRAPGLISAVDYGITREKKGPTFAAQLAILQPNDTVLTTSDCLLVPGDVIAIDIVEHALQPFRFLRVSRALHRSRTRPRCQVTGHYLLMSDVEDVYSSIDEQCSNILFQDIILDTHSRAPIVVPCDRIAHVLEGGRLGFEVSPDFIAHIARCQDASDTLEQEDDEEPIDIELENADSAALRAHIIAERERQRQEARMNFIGSLDRNQRRRAPSSHYADFWQ